MKTKHLSPLLGSTVMKAKRLIVAVVLVCAAMLYAGTSSAAVTKIGYLSMQNTTETSFTEVSDNWRTLKQSSVFSAGQLKTRVPVFFDSLMAMQMALNAGEIHEMSLPEVVAEYVMSMNDSYTILTVVRTLPVSLSFGFRKGDDPALLNSFNEVLKAIDNDGTLAILQKKYIADAGKNTPEPVKFEDFGKDAKTIKAAVTGDLPPIDYVEADGQPAGFNTAILAEVAKRLKINIELVNIESAARAASLASGRSDVVFWFMSFNGFGKQLDLPDDVAVSEPYYSWTEYLNLKLSNKK